MFITNCVEGLCDVKKTKQPDDLLVLAVLLTPLDIKALM